MDAPRGMALVCLECNRTSVGDARDWRALLNEDNEPVVYCPHCFEREFGLAPWRSRRHRDSWL